MGVMLQHKVGGNNMFINELDKVQGKAFLCLLKGLAKVDYAFGINEYKLIDEYCKELGVEESEIDDSDTKEALKCFTGTVDRIKNIVYFELLGLALIDGEFDSKEVQFLDSIAAELKISKEKQKSCLNYFKELKSTYENVSGNVEEVIKELQNRAEAIVR